MPSPGPKFLLRQDGHFSTFTEKESPVGADVIVVEDSAAQGVKKHVQLMNLGGGLSAVTHKTLRQLIHFIDDGPAEGFASGSFKEILPAANPFPTSEVWWESSSKLKKILELTTTRNANQTPATEEWKMYDTDGSTVLVTLTDTIAYSGVFETTRTRALT